MLRLNQVLGNRSEPEMAERLHAFEHEGRIEYLALRPEDTRRKRLRLTTDRGTDCAIALGRAQGLSDGDVLWLDDERAVLVSLSETRWLRLRARDAPSALELGYFAGNLHWRVRFDGEVIAIALDGAEADYRARLAPFLESGRAREVNHG
ncbi:MAG: urease accessory protein UreE [Alphaproteobacteria bacterium]|nr:urease accessory protein UreE [Pseudomonadota bacterium]